MSRSAPDGPLVLGSRNNSLLSGLYLAVAVAVGVSMLGVAMLHLKSLAEGVVTGATPLQQVLALHVTESADPVMGSLGSLVALVLPAGGLGAALMIGIGLRARAGGSPGGWYLSLSGLWLALGLSLVASLPVAELWRAATPGSPAMLGLTGACVLGLVLARTSRAGRRP